MPSRPAAFGSAALALLAAAGLAGCAPTNTNTTYTAGSIGVAAQVRYGTIVGMQPVAIQGSRTGAGAGALVEQGVTQGSAVQFTIRPDGGGPDYTVVQTNELALQVGERVAVSFGDRARLQRVAGGPAPYAASAYAPQQGYAAPVSQVKRY